MTVTPYSLTRADRIRGGQVVMAIRLGLKRPRRPIGQECYACGGPAEEWDHLIPRSMGGTDDDANVAPICRRDNASKNWRTPEQWLAAGLRGAGPVGRDGQPTPPPSLRSKVGRANEGQRNPARRNRGQVRPEAGPERQHETRPVSCGRTA